MATEYTEYDITFRYEILNEIIASVGALINRSFRGEMPADITEMDNEVWDIYRKIPFENNIDVLDNYKSRLLEIRDQVKTSNKNEWSDKMNIRHCYEFSKEELETEIDIIYAAYRAYKYPASDPTAFLLGGQSGSGKSTIQRIFSGKRPNSIIIDGDRFRDRHPRFNEIRREYGKDAANYSQPFANAIANALIERFGSEHYDLIIEGTCRTVSVPLKSCEQLKVKGYTVVLAVMCTDKDTAWQSAIDRHNEMEACGLAPRAVPRDKYEATVKALPNNISELYKSGKFDDILLFNRNKECLYRFKETPDRDPSEIVARNLYNK